MKKILVALILIAAVLVVPAAPAHAVTICEKYGLTTIQSGRYVVQNNNWGDDTTQCINTTSTGFSITTANHNKPTNGAPGSYPSVFFGCHYTNCSSGSGLPVQANTSYFTGLNTGVSMGYVSSGVWDAAYDIWFDPTPRTDGQNTGAEIMIWLNKLGPIQPVGSQIGTVSLAGGTWNVWFGNIGWNVISYVRQSSTSSMNFAVDTFYSDAVNRGYAQRSWYLTSIQAGFEPWVGQTGLSVNSFSVTSGPGGGDTQPPSTPANLSSSGTTSTSTNLSWSGSTDNFGVTGYDVYRNGSAITTVSGTSANIAGLSPSTTYQFYVRARDAAGNLSGNSNTVSVTTQPGGGGGGACSASFTANQWNVGYTGNVVITNTSSVTTTSWAVTFALPPGHVITNYWGAQVTIVGQTITARNVAYNGTLQPNQSTTWGFQASRPNGNTSLPSTFSCTL